MAYDPPELEIKDKTFGLVSPEAFELPTMSPLWTAVAYASFDTALTDKEKKKQVENTKKRSLKVQLGEYHFMFNSVPVVAVCLRGRWAVWMEPNRK